MLASKLIEVLTKIVKNNGDMEVFVEEGQFTDYLPLTTIILNLSSEEPRVTLSWGGDK